ncbi:MAG: M56 family metallopeptidase [Bacteroidales bacterium]
MGSFIVYIIKSALCLALFYLFYKLLLSKDTFHRFNRMALLGIFLLSIVLPFAKLSLQSSPDIMHAFAGMDSLSAKVLQDEELSSQSSLYWVLAVVLLYLAGFAGSLLRQLISYFSLFRLIKKSKRVQKIDNIAVLTHNEAIAPFSWMRYILLSEKDYEENAAAILSHELAHIHKKHSWDLVLADLCIAFQWFNPAAWLFRQELQNIHEFEADDSVLKQGIDAKQYQLLIIKKAVGTRLYSMANSFNHSSLKNRITMMLKEKSKPWARLKYFYVLPMAGLAMFAFAHPNVSRLEETSREKVNELLALAQTDNKNSAELSTDKINYILGYNVPGEVKNTEKQSSQTAGLNSSKEDWTIVEDVPGKNDLALLQSESTLPETVVVTYGSAKEQTPPPPPPPPAKKGKANILPPPPPPPAKTERGEIPPPPPVPQEEIFITVEEMPQYPGGEKALMEYISKSIRYPTKALENGISGKVICSFVIDSKGKVTNIQVIRSIDPDLDREAVRVIENMPDWTPGKQRGKIVPVRYTMPIIFKLQAEPSEETVKEEFLNPDEMPVFPGGEKALMEYINNELRYPKTAYENGIQGRVICNYVIDSQGKVTNSKVIRSVHPDLDQEALRVIQKMPDWTPGQKDGKAVAVEYTLPIIFKLQ